MQRRTEAGLYEPGLDGLRGAALLVVLLIHATTMSMMPWWFRGGTIGVTIFFCMSGYLITTILMRDIDANGSVNLSRFWGRRIRRLAPAALTAAFVIVVFHMLGVLPTFRSDVIANVWCFTNLRMVAATQPPWWRTGVGPFGPTWSLALEEQFYLVVAGVASVAAITRRPVRNLAIVFSAFTVMSLVLAIFVIDWKPHLLFGTDIRAAEPAIGCLLALAVRRWRPLLAGRERIADVAAMVGVVILVAIILFAGAEQTFLLRGGFAVVSLVSAVVMVGILAHGTVDRVFSWRPLGAIGRVSYSVYLVHFPVMLLVTTKRFGLETWPLVWLKLAVTFAVGLALFYGVEHPIRRRNDLSNSTTVIWWLAGSATVTLLAVLVTPN